MILDGVAFTGNYIWADCLLCARTQLFQRILLVTPSPNPYSAYLYSYFQPYWVNAGVCMGLTVPMDVMVIAIITICCPERVVLNLLQCYAVHTRPTGCPKTPRLGATERLIYFGVAELVM